MLMTSLNRVLGNMGLTISSRMGFELYCLGVDVVQNLVFGLSLCLGVDPRPPPVLLRSSQHTAWADSERIIRRRSSALFMWIELNRISIYRQLPRHTWPCEALVAAFATRLDWWSLQVQVVHPSRPPVANPSHFVHRTDIHTRYTTLFPIAQRCCSSFFSAAFAAVLLEIMASSIALPVRSTNTSPSRAPHWFIL